MLFEFLLLERPVSLQTRNRQNLQAWKASVRAEASKTWAGPPCNGKKLDLTLVFLYKEDELDLDNIIKPIQDALIGLIYDDDSIICDIESHKRSLTEVSEDANYPKLLIAGINSGEECVYVRISESKPLGDYFHERNS